MMNYRFAHRTVGEEAYSSRYEASRSRYQGGRADGTFGIVLADAARDAVRAVRRWHRYRKTVVALARLDDRMLRDIGLNRDEITSVARGLSLRDQTVWSRG